jgi:hypothetical protein
MSEAIKRPRPNQRKARSFLIAPARQIPHALFTVFSIGSGMAILGLLFFIYSSKMSQLAIDQGADAELIRQMNAQAVTTFFLVSSALTLIFCYLNIMYTHRIFGSLFSIERYLRGLLDGESDLVLHSRKTDQTQSLVEVVRQLGAKMKQSSDSKLS